MPAPSDGGGTHTCVSGLFASTYDVTHVPLLLSLSLAVAAAAAAAAVEADAAVGRRVGVDSSTAHAVGGTPLSSTTAPPGLDDDDDDDDVEPGSGACFTW